MTKQEYIVEEPYELTATPISWLERLGKDELSADDLLLLASQPNFQVQDTGYISKSIMLGDLKESLSESLGTQHLQDEISEISTTLKQLAEVSAALEALDTKNLEIGTASNPCIVNSISCSQGNLVDADVTPLSDAFETTMTQNVFSKGAFTALSCTNLTALGGNVNAAIRTATSTTAGTVKVYAAGTSTPEDSNIYVITNNGSPLHIPKSRIRNIVDEEIESHINEIVQAVVSKVQQTFYKTEVVASLPQILSPNTIYYIPGN